MDINPDILEDLRMETHRRISRYAHTLLRIKSIAVITNPDLKYDPVSHVLMFRKEFPDCAVYVVHNLVYKWEIRNNHNPVSTWEIVFKRGESNPKKTIVRNYLTPKAYLLRSAISLFSLVVCTYVVVCGKATGNYPPDLTAITLAAFNFFFVWFMVNNMAQASRVSWFMERSTKIKPVESCPLPNTPIIKKFNAGGWTLHTSEECFRILETVKQLRPTPSEQAYWALSGEVPKSYFWEPLVKVIDEIVTEFGRDKIEDCLSPLIGEYKE